MGFAGVPAERREKRQRVLNAAQIGCGERILLQMAQYPAIVLMCDKEAQSVKKFFSFQSGRILLWLEHFLLCPYAGKSSLSTKE